MSGNTRSFSVAIDTGGTFTDITLVDRSSGDLWNAKTPSTPSDPSIGFITGVGKALDLAGCDPQRISHVFHGTTVATNTILEMKGAPSALLTTAGFKHLLEIGRHDIPRSANMYSWEKPRRPIPPERIFEIDERLEFSGEVLAPLAEEQVRDAVGRIKAKGISAIGVCYLHSYANPAHEQRTREIIEDMFPETMISLSSEVLPTFREYERSMVTMLNIYVMPVIANYVSQLEERLADEKIDGHLLLMKSSGGVTGVDTVRRVPVHTALSGPAGGVVGAGLVGDLAGTKQLITLDIGGTSADICLIDGGAPAITTTGSVGEWPLHLPMIDIHTIGAGGGSIAYTNGSTLTVGPQSAGAEPGPVCYGGGGDEPTVTDAHLVLGHLTPTLLDGEIALDHGAALRAIESKIAGPLGIDVFEAAKGIIDISNNNMMGAIRVVSIERGYDPSRFALVPFGGAGPLHGGFITRLLRMNSAIVPPNPGVLAAFGLLVSDVRNEFTRTCLQLPPDYDLEVLGATFAELEGLAQHWLEEEGIPPDGRSTQWMAGIRYRHQGHELAVDWPAHRVDQASVTGAVERFHQLHEQLYTFKQSDTPVEIVTVTVVAKGALAKPTVSRIGDGVPVEEAQIGIHSVYVAGEWVEAPIFDRRKLGVAARLAGPVIVTQMDATTFVLPGQAAKVDAFGNLIIREA